MRNGLIGLVSAMALASTMATAACSDASSSGATPASTGGSSSSGGNAPSTGGQQSTGGSAAGGAAMGGAATGGSATGGSATGGAAMGGSSGSATGGAATGGSPPSVTTLSDTKALNALTTDELTQLCNDTFAYYGSAISRATVCKWKGVLFATQSSAPTEEILRQNCTAKETPCLADTASPWPFPSCGDIAADCTKTVADYSACIRDFAAWLTQKVSEVPSCDAFTSAYWDPVWAIVGADQPASCQFCASYYAPDPRQF